MSVSPGGPDLASLSSLDDPLRRRLYEVVTGRPGPASRDEAASAAGIGRALAVYHLDKLVESGLLTASYQRPPGRSGPGAGRPAKVYARSDREFAVSVPPREYELAARLLVQVVEGDPSGGSRAALGEAARRLGTELGGAFRSAKAGAGPADPGEGGSGHGGSGHGGSGHGGSGHGGSGHGGSGHGGSGHGGSGHGGSGAGAEPEGQNAAARDVKAVLAQQGYEPRRDGDGVIRLRNCPFHQLAEQHREVVCGMNLALVEGLVDGLGTGGWHPVLDPQPGHCCVAIGGDRP